MIKKNKKAILILIATIICFTFSACINENGGDSDNVPTNMALIYGKHQNSKKIQPDLTNDIKDIYMASKDSKLTLIEVDSNPSVIHVDVTDIINDKNYERWRKDRQHRINHNSGRNDKEKVSTIQRRHINISNYQSQGALNQTVRFFLSARYRFATANII